MKKILIIEDDKSIEELERDYLEIENFSVDIEKTGTGGLKKAKESGYSLIILDLMLPRMNGFEICRQLRREKEIPILIVSAKKEDIFLEFILDTKKISTTSLKTNVLIKTIDISEYYVLPDFVSDLYYVPSDGIRLLVDNKIINSWDEFYNKSIKPISQKIINKIQSSSFNQTLQTEFNWDINTTFNSSGEYLNGFALETSRSNFFLDSDGFIFGLSSTSDRSGNRSKVVKLNSEGKLIKTCAEFTEHKTARRKSEEQFIFFRAYHSYTHRLLLTALDCKTPTGRSVPSSSADRRASVRPSWPERWPASCSPTRMPWSASTCPSTWRSSRSAD